MAGEMTKNDPWSYLKGTGLPSGGAAKKGSTAMPAMSKPDPNERKPGVAVARISVSRPAEHKQPDPAMTAKRKSADTANIEGNESAKYEKLEKRSLKGLKGGGTEKELRAGHNTKQRVLAGTAIEKAGRKSAKQAIRTGGAAGAAVARERPVIAAKMAAKQAGVTGKARREMVQTARQSTESRRSERQARRGAIRSARRSSY